MVKIYGIKNCDTMKKALKWLDERHISYQFHNYKTDGLSSQLLQSLFNLIEWQLLLNTKGTTWRKLDEATRNTINNQASAKQLMLQNPSIIKRPILVAGDKALVGFSEQLYQQFFAS
ncbi:ArsC family reductase [Orbus sturtevantii]|uniref:ArsC family reductase n=1 Tax=Orbus sturtevantii TaxID=3074109 RepID=UPI00370D0BD5